MPGQEFKNLDDYEKTIKTIIKHWTSERQTVLAAAMAERWLPVYQDFSFSEGWGDPEVLRRSLDRVWSWLENHHSTGEDWARLRGQVHEVTPHMDDFDANEALCACVMVQYALDCASAKDPFTSALMGVLSGLEAVLPGLLDEEPVPARLWRKPAVRKEISSQTALIEIVGALVDLPRARQALEPFYRDAQVMGVVQPRPKAPGGPTNEQAFEQYRQIILMDIKSASSNLDPRHYPDLATTLYLAAWMGRYSRRKQIISGEYGVLVDQAAVAILMEKNRALDHANNRRAAWDEEARGTIELCYQNSYNGLDAATPESPHAYGPSLRRLWVEAKMSGLDNQQAWESIAAWAARVPAGWGQKPRKSASQAEASLVLADKLKQPVAWTSSGDVQIPWAAEFEGALWQVRLNDFPDEMMYSLLINGQEAGDFHDWPPAWRRL